MNQIWRIHRKPIRLRRHGVGSRKLGNEFRSTPFPVENRTLQRNTRGPGIPAISGILSSPPPPTPSPTTPYFDAPMKSAVHQPSRIQSSCFDTLIVYKLRAKSWQPNELKYSTELMFHLKVPDPRLHNIIAFVSLGGNIYDLATKSWWRAAGGIFCHDSIG